jgi:hypothetical protein
MTQAKKIRPDPVRKGANRDRAKSEPEELEREHREEALDQTLAESYPASDPPSTIPNPDEDPAA